MWLKKTNLVPLCGGGMQPGRLEAGRSIRPSAPKIVKNTMGPASRSLRDIGEIRTVVLMKNSMLGLEGRQN